VNYVIILPCVKGLAYLRQHNLHLGRLVWLGATLAIMVLALVAPLSAATLSRRARAVHARSHLSRGVQTSRLGISADAIEGGVIRGLSSVGLSGARIDHGAVPPIQASCGVTPRVPRNEFSAFVAVASAVLAPVRNPFIACAAPRGPPTA
jgi:hypothetical protein